MKTRPNQRLIAGGIGFVLIVALMVSVFMRASTVSSGTGTEPRLLKSGAHRGPAAAPSQQMPSGIERSLAVNIPLLGRIHGARWIPDQRFRELHDSGIISGPKTERALDVLVDNDGTFIAARFNGERFATAPPEESLKNLLRQVIDVADGSLSIYDPPVPPVVRVAMARLKWDDPGLGNAIKKLINRRFGSWHSEGALSRFEETYFALEVWFAGMTDPRRIMLRRYTEGLADGGVPYPPPPGGWDVGSAIRNSNRYGASVVSYAEEIGTAPDNLGLKAGMYLTEPWAGPCPWPSDKLDPIFGENRLNEFVMPTEMGPQYMVDIFHFTPHSESAADWGRARAAQNHAARLAAEAAGKQSKR